MDHLRGVLLLGAHVLVISTWILHACARLVIPLFQSVMRLSHTPFSRRLIKQPTLHSITDYPHCIHLLYAHSLPPRYHSVLVQHQQHLQDRLSLAVQIEAIRSEMDIEVNRLIAIIHKKNVDLTDLETKLVNRLRWGIVVLQSKNENLIRRQVLQWWR